MLMSSATSNRASMLAAASGFCKERKSDTSTLAKPSDEGKMVAVLPTTVEKVWADEEECTPGLISPTLEEDAGKQHDGELAGLCWDSGSCDRGEGSGFDVYGSFWADTLEEELFEFFSLAESLQAHWHWQDSSCLMMMTGRLRPICWTELPEDKNKIYFIVNVVLKSLQWRTNFWPGCNGGGGVCSSVKIRSIKIVL